MELRKYTHINCKNNFWVDCEDTDYPNYCPFCGDVKNNRNFIMSKATIKLHENQTTRQTLSFGTPYNTNDIESQLQGGLHAYAAAGH